MNRYVCEYCGGDHYELYCPTLKEEYEKGKDEKKEEEDPDKKEDDPPKK